MKENLSKENLIEKLSSGCKNKDDWRIGTEHEKFGFKKKDLSPINFNDIQNIFLNLSSRFNWIKIKENGNIIGLKKNKSSITLEPGGQIELSGAPLKSLFETCKEVNQHHDELNAVCRDSEIEFMGMGVLPKWGLRDLKLMPKKRYQIMSQYMPKVGKKGLDMMMRTTTIQANFDFMSESDMIKKLRVAQAIQPVILALYANSPFVEGKLTKYLSYRSYIWTETDRDRCGLLPFIHDESFSFERYVDFALDVPMYFIIRDENYIDLSGQSFRDFLGNRIKFQEDIQPTISDWETHLTTIFPEVRLKSFIELRGADGGPWSRVCALPAFWTGILYDQDVLDQVFDIVNNWNFVEIKNFYNDARTKGFKSYSPNNENLLDFAKKMISLSSRGLRNRNIKLSGKTEDYFLEPLEKIINSGITPADNWKKLYLNQWSNNIDMLYTNNYFK